MYDGDAFDPFQTQDRATVARGRTLLPPEEPAQGRQLEDVVDNPFLTGVVPEGGHDVLQDPFMTANIEVRTRPPLPRFGHWLETVKRIMGPGDPDRKLGVRNVLILGPWLIFVWVLLLQIVLRHFAPDLCWMLIGLLFLAAAWMLITWNSGKRWGQVNLLSLGLMSLLAVSLGAYLGDLGWNTNWRQYWWMQTGEWFDSVSASTPAGASVDAAVLQFRYSSTDDLHINETAVDDLRSVGYKDTDFFCVAPILNPRESDATLIRVNYWAIGINCCQEYGSFTCDDSRVMDGGYGVVMLNGGYPCPDCNDHQFRMAVVKAESTYGLVSAPSALFVRWVSNPYSLRRSALLGGIFFIVLSTIFAAALFTLLGTILWYYGVGKRSLFPEQDSQEDAAKPKVV